jgi:hypothetical protein
VVLFAQYASDHGVSVDEMGDEAGEHHNQSVTKTLFMIKRPTVF